MSESSNKPHRVSDARPSGLKGLSPPIDLSAATAFVSPADLAATQHDLTERLRYSRDQSAGSQYVESWLEMDPSICGKRALVFPSGMAAIDCFMAVHYVPDCEIFMPPEQYRKTRTLATFWARSVQTYDGGRDLDERLTRSRAPKKIVLCESPGNPHLRLTNAQAVGEIARRHSAPSLFDGTFAGLSNCYTAYAQFDVVAHSATKYVVGHNDVIGGLLFVNPEDRRLYWERRGATCGPLDPFSCFLLCRSLDTYDLRVNTQVENAQRVVEFLLEEMQEGSLRGVWYPGVGNNEDQAALASKQLLHRGAVVSFEGSHGLPERLDVSTLAPFQMAPSFGSTRTLLEQPSKMSHWGKTEKELDEIGLEYNLIRLSVGTEDIRSIMDALRHLLRLVCD